MPSHPTRRRALALLAGMALADRGQAHGGLGPETPPRPLPGLALLRHDGQRQALHSLLAGRVTALQLMFTGCSATCPVQGAVFAALQPLVLGLVPGAQLLSLSIDPLNDDARALAGWLGRLGARPGWVAAAPPLPHADVLPELLQARRPGPDRHNAQVVLVDRQARLAYRMAEFASAQDIARAMQALARQG